MKIINLKTSWDFKIFQRKNFEKERKETLENLENFYQKWSGLDLRKPKNLINFIKDYEKLISKPPGIFDREYTYYFLKNLLNIKDKKTKKKLAELRKLRQECFDKIFSLLEPLKTLTKKERNKILNSPLLKNYKIFLERAICPPNEIFEIPQSPNLSLLREKISEEIKKYKEKLFEDKNLQDKVLKKYAQLGEKAFNEVFEQYSSKVFYQKILKIIKKYLIQNKKLVRNFNEKLQLKKKDLDNFLNSKISLKESLSLIIEGFNKIDKNFGKIILNYFQKGLVDVYPKKNKYLTPRNVTISKFLPPFILLNFEENFRSLPHMIHELAHALHSEYLRKYNSPLNASQSPIIRETIAYFFEFSVLENLKEKYDVLLLDLYLNKIKTNSIYFNAVLLLAADDSYRYYKKTGYLAFDKLAKIFKKNLNLIFGEKRALQTSDYEILLHFSKGILWHFPYLIATILANFLKNLSKNNLLKLLKAGSNKSLEEIFKEI